MSKRKPDIWIVLVLVIGLGVIATTQAERASVSDKDVNYGAYSVKSDG